MKHWKLFLRLTLALALLVFAMAVPSEQAIAGGDCAQVCPEESPHNICTTTVYCLCDPHGGCGIVTSCATCLCS